MEITQSEQQTEKHEKMKATYKICGVIQNIPTYVW